MRKIQFKHYKYLFIFLVSVFYIFIQLFRYLEIELLVTEKLGFDHRIDLFYLSLLFSFLFFPILNGNWKKIFQVLWILPVCYIVMLITIWPKHIEKLDYLIGCKQSFRVEQHFEGKWISNYIIIDNSDDTIFYNQHLRWVDEFNETLITKENIENLEVRKSITQHFYHLRLLE